METFGRSYAMVEGSSLNLQEISTMVRIWVRKAKGELVIEIKWVSDSGGYNSKLLEG